MARCWLLLHQLEAVKAFLCRCWQQSLFAFQPYTKQICAGRDCPLWQTHAAVYATIVSISVNTASLHHDVFVCLSPADLESKPYMPRGFNKNIFWCSANVVYDTRLMMHHIHTVWLLPVHAQAEQSMNEPLLQLYGTECNKRAFQLTVGRNWNKWAPSANMQAECLMNGAPRNMPRVVKTW